MKPLWSLAVAAVACIGCQSVLPGSKPAETGRVMTGKVGSVGSRVSRAFKEVGAIGGECAAWSDEEGDGMSVLGATPDGRKFRVMLRQAGKSTTRGTMVWDGKADDEFGEKLLTALAKE